ncbi:MAG TPA: pitrilysin family protein [Candidatus Saccharicenans sp.]|jgi:zinc protease|nr:pitrilysin family protein [Candidatus Saccharicenans sp.]HQO76450.1 pitrilysin family protein [Candidatus Saccharicenans sp.]
MPKKTVIFILSLCWLTVMLQASFKKEDIKVFQLDNGLKIILYEDHKIPNISYYTFFKVGSRCERPGLTGVSHFIEHMMFNGTKKYGPGQFDRLMEFNGGANNAYTGDDFTAYTDWFPSTALEKMVELEADRMQGLLFDPQVLESERGVVASERRMSVENNNEAILYENVRATAIMAHPYHWDVIGWMSDILGWRPDDIKQYYQTYYAPNNAVLVVVGDFESSKLMELIKKYYGPIPAQSPPPPIITVEPPQQGRKEVVVRKEAQTPSFMVVYHGPACTSPDFFALSILQKPLVEGESSRLYRRLVRQEQLALSVSGGIEEKIDPFLFMIEVKPRPGVDLTRIEKIIDEELAKIIQEGLTETEFEKARNIGLSSFYFGLQTNSGKANMLGAMEMLYGSYERLFTYIDSYLAVKREDIPSVARKYFNDLNKTAGYLLPEGGQR